MSDLIITGSQSTPAINGNWANGLLAMHGDSYPENSFEFFTPIFQWVEHFIAQSQQPLTLELHLLYLNTSSIKAVMDIFDLLESAHHAGRSVAVNWHYGSGNERIAQVAEEFKEDFSFPFNILSQ